MAIKIYGPGDFVPDPGGNGRLYPIESKKVHQDIVFNNKIQPTNHNQANLVAIFTEWFTSFFEPNYFKYIRIKTQSSFNDFKSFMKNIYKKDCPGLVIDPRPMELVEDFIYAQNSLNRYNLIDPKTDILGAKMLYSRPVMKSDLFELVYRPNRLRAEFDIMIMERTINRQTNTYNMMLMNMRHNTKFMLERNVPMLIPFEYMANIAKWHGYPVRSDDFVKFLNSIAAFPIRKEVRTNGRLDFFMIRPLHIQVEIPGFPDRDTPENSEAIEIAARVVDRFIFVADLPAEFIFLTRKEYVGKYDNHIDEGDYAISYISPIYADLDWPKEFGEFKLSNRIDVELQAGDDTKINIMGFIHDLNPDMHDVIVEWVKHGGNIKDMVMVHVWPNGSYIEIGTDLYQNGVVEMFNPIMNKLYSLNIYLNINAINLIRDSKNRKYIGTIEQSTSDNAV